MIAPGAYGWPPRMIMRVACAYTGRTRWTLTRAARLGELPVAGKNGRSLVFDREALDRWMIGGGETSAAPPPPEPRVRSAGSQSTAEALARLRTLAGGTR